MDFHDCELETQLKGALQVVCGIKVHTSASLRVSTTELDI